MWPMNFAPSACSAFISGVRAAASRAGLVVEPQLGDAVDLDRRRRYVGPRALALDVILHVAAQSGHGQRQRRMDLDPVLHELLVRPAVLAREQADRLDHDGRLSSVRASMRHDPLSRDRIPCVVCRQCVGRERTLPQCRGRQQRGRTGDFRLGRQAQWGGAVSRDHPGAFLRRHQPAHRHVGQAAGQLGLPGAGAGFLRPARREGGVHHAVCRDCPTCASPISPAHSTILPRVPTS